MYSLLPFLATFLLLSPPVFSSSPPFPDTPFTTSSRDVLGASGRRITFAGVNWPGAAETMLPEGLQYASVADIVTKIKSLGMNVVRLTYAMEMVDDVIDGSAAAKMRGTLEGTLIQALGPENGAKVLGMVLKKNPGFKKDMGRLEVFDAVAEELARQEIWVHLDNHMSSAGWCCSPLNGNAWFGDTKFPVSNWQRGLGYMANHVKSWTSLASMSLRNELRPPLDLGLLTAQPYNWVTWYNNMVPAAHIIHGNNSGPLIFFSGLNWDKDASKIIDKQSLGLINGPYFNPSTYDFANKIVVELHNYKNDGKSIVDVVGDMYTNAYGAMNVSDDGYYHVPVVLSEFGFDNTNSAFHLPYAQALKDYVVSQPGGPGGWMQWVVAGSYYIREGTQDSDETWGLFNHDWSGWRNQTVIDQYVTPFVKATLS